jgi:hypothetical protein
MKPVLLVLLVFLGLSCIIPSCQKSSNNSTGSQDSVMALTGKWSIVSDSLANINNYTFSGGYPVPGFYTGVPADFWEFLQSGQLNVHENNNDYHSSFQLQPNHLIVIADKVEFKDAVIDTLTPHSCTIHGSDTSSNGGIVIEILILKR